uniref:Uncharacterized mitochondrial protein AtMg00810-like n=1 Tax=Nicotiana tabacum TaxID=4097 RepID=A0A1S4BIA7_TOBAC|nr:PREDICTED: uncharacterized mitochondrial protein AtMg00810-like [Nicotiana tabacum]
MGQSKFLLRKRETPLVNAMEETRYRPQKIPANKFVVRDLGKLSYVLGIEAHWTSAGLYLQQGKYMGDLLKCVQMDSCSNVSTPASPSTKLSSTEGSQFNDSTLYRSVVGELQYLSFTRPDIAFAINKVSQFMHCPMDIHWTVVKRILRYIKATPSHGLFFAQGTSTLLHGYTDSHWGGDVNDRKSTTGFAIILGFNLISWALCKQRAMSRSSIEAEYRALATATSEII